MVLRGTENSSKNNSWAVAMEEVKKLPPIGGRWFKSSLKEISRFFIFRELILNDRAAQKLVQLKKAKKTTC